jgi:DnaJ-class molecular chaperone
LELLLNSLVCKKCIFSKKFRVCSGEGSKIYKIQEEITIPEGISTSDLIRIKRKVGLELLTLKGHCSELRSGIEGDLILKAHVKSHPEFSRDNLDIISKIPINLSQVSLRKM